MIDAESLSFSYVSELTGERVEALRGVDLSVRPGTLTLVCGASGCGKSTLMRALTGLVPQMTPGELEGVVRINGRDLAEVPLTEVGHLCSSVFQNPRTQFFCDTVAEELAFCGENYGRDRETLIESSERAADLMGIAHLMDRKLSTLSGGQLQKVALACALASGAPVLLADEPTSNLDPDAIADVRRALAILKDQGMTIIVVEHRLHFLRGLADQVLLMEGGTITRRWTGEEFYSLDDAQRRSLGLRTLVDPGPPEAWVHSVGTAAKATAEGEVRLSCRDLSFSYGNAPVFEGLDVDFPAGQITCIAGENGAGKTTLVRVLCGLAAPDSGTITLDGASLPKDCYNPVQLIYQHPEKAMDRVGRSVIRCARRGLCRRNFSQRLAQSRTGSRDGRMSSRAVSCSGSRSCVRSVQRRACSLPTRSRRALTRSRRRRSGR